MIQCHAIEEFRLDQQTVFAFDEDAWKKFKPELEAEFECGIG